MPALLHSFPATPTALLQDTCYPKFDAPETHFPVPVPVSADARRTGRSFILLATASRIFSPATLDKSTLVVAEANSEEELRAASGLRVRSFYQFRSSFAIDDHKRYLGEHEFEALKERISGRSVGFRRVCCINASLPLLQISTLSDELCSSSKISDDGEDRLVVGTLDLNQCLRLPGEITGKKPEGIGADFARAYLSNVCVAKELHQNGLGYALVSESEMIARKWGITDLYVHVAVDNEAAKRLYVKCGFIHEEDEPAWQARFLDRPRRILLWKTLTPANHKP